MYKVFSCFCFPNCCCFLKVWWTHEGLGVKIKRILKHRGLYSHVTIRLLEILRGSLRPGCATRQSNFLPFMLRTGRREKWMETAPPSLVRRWDSPSRSVSQDSSGSGRPTARQVTTTGWPSTTTGMGSKEEMGKAGKTGEVSLRWKLNWIRSVPEIF